MNTVVTVEGDVRRARRAFLVVGLVAPLVIAAVTVVVLLGWLPDLPERIITHWGPSGPDGFAAPLLIVWTEVGLGIALPLLMTVPIFLAVRHTWGPSCRFLAAASLAVSGLLAIVFLGSAAMQRETSDPGFGIGAVVVVASAAMVVLGALGWLLQPKVIASAKGATEAKRLRLEPGQRAAWFGTAAMSRPGVVALAISVLILVATTAWTMVMDAAVGWILALVTLLLVALILTTLVFRVRVNAAGLRVRSVAGWPRWSIATSEITDVQVVRVNPMAEFGGWGLRIAVDGRMGIVLRTGEALQVTRSTGRVFVITIDDARTAASVLITATKDINS